MKSGLEMLEELLDKVETLTKKVDILEQSIKKIANSTKVSELLEKNASKHLKGWGNHQDQEKIQLKEKGKVPPLQEIPVVKMPYKKIEGPLVKGRMILNGEKPAPLSGLTVKIFDSRNNLIKSTKTNMAGTWMCRLEGGQKYAVEITGQYKEKDLVPVNKVISVPVGVDEYEVN
jgi:hypothetical protein